MSTIHSQIKLIAHRGLRGEHYENTLPAFINACKSDFYGIETDIQFTKDNKIICFHDKTLRRLIGEKTKISDLRYRDLLLKDFKQRTSITETTNICPFKKYLKICRKYKKVCVIEIKYKTTHKQLDKLMRQIKFYRYLKNCIIISFNADDLLYLRSKFPTLRLQLIVTNPLKRYTSFCKVNKIDVSIFDRIINRETVAKLRSNGIKVAVWTVNSPAQAQRMVDMGVNYITSDYLL